jgi:hypothetical protein
MCQHCGTSSIEIDAQRVAPASHPQYAMQLRDLEMSRRHLCNDPGTIAKPCVCLHDDIEVTINACGAQQQESDINIFIYAHSAMAEDLQ